MSILVDHPILLIFVVLGLGAALGAVRVKGISLGPAGALFAGLGLSAIDDRLAIPDLVGTLGLALFTYTIGLSSGPAFFASLRSQARTIAAVVTALVLAALTARVVASLFSFGTGVTAGLFAGALTNTPALAAAREALNGSNDPVVGYSVAYPVGVIGMILAAAVVARMGRRHPNTDDRSAPADLSTVTILVRPGLHISLSEIAERFAGEVVFARLEREGTQAVPSPDFVVQEGDLVSVTAPRASLPDVQAMLGEQAPTQLSNDRTRLDMRRIVVSDRRLTGRRLVDLGLHERFGAVATRVRRGDVDLLAHDDFTVLPGDRLRIVAPRDRISEITSYLGDSERRLAEIDALGFMLGIALGLALGLISVPLFSSGHFALGTAGGPLIVGLVVGRLERSGPIVWQPPYGANLALRQFGTLLFLGTVGSRSGAALVDAMSSPQGAKLVVGALLVVAVTAVFTVVAGRAFLGLGAARLAGTLAGLETQPAVLAFVNEQTADDRVGTAYALVFPVAMLTKIVLAQVLALW
jgi:putative transport protein